MGGGEQRRANRTLHPVASIVTEATPSRVRARGPQFGPNATAWLLLAPATLFLVLLFVVPIGFVLVRSLTDPTLTLAHYRRILTVPLYTGVMLNTFRTSLIVTARASRSKRSIDRDVPNVPG